MMSCVAMAASSRPEILVSSMMPPGPSSRESMSEKRIVSHMTTCARTTATTTAIHEPDVRSGLPDGHHDGDDRAGASQQRRPQRDERDVHALVPRIGRRGVGAHEEFHGDQEQQDAAGELERLHRDVQEAQDLPAEDREGQDDTEGDGGRLDGGAPLLGLGVAGR